MDSVPFYGVLKCPWRLLRIRQRNSVYKAGGLVNNAQPLLTVLHKVNFVIKEVATRYRILLVSLYVWVKRILQIPIRRLPCLICGLRLATLNRAYENRAFPLQSDLPESQEEMGDDRATVVHIEGQIGLHHGR